MSKTRYPADFSAKGPHDRKDGGFVQNAKWKQVHGGIGSLGCNARGFWDMSVHDVGKYMELMELLG